MSITADGRTELTIIGSLSPSRASDFKTCPLLYRFRSIDRLPERPSAAATRGTLVHAVLERLFDLPAGERSPAAAEALLEPEWARLADAEPELIGLFETPEALADWLESARGLLAGYFTLEDPNRLAPAERERLVEVVTESGLRLRGFVDRIDVAPTGEIRVVDYKTGAAPRESFEGKAMFQLKFYALVIWRTRGVVPRLLRLLYLGDREVLDYTPDLDELLRFERTLQAIWAAIDRATAARDFRPSPGPLCGWCDHQELCPAHGGTLPPFPEQLPPLTESPATDPASED
ncbi:RecB family exonuclease [Cryptosporangium arvum]|uniref:RecB family exonuclease n=1 Tax=Cryptosporangium arvum TaxID=80871 RepID=UPI0005672796|nr:RecB family exonuclease [Cryptosporangium arvum]